MSYRIFISKHRDLLLPTAFIGVFFLFAGFILGSLDHFEAQGMRCNNFSNQTKANTSNPRQQERMHDIHERAFSVSGRVLGNPYANSTVSLYAVPDTEHGLVMATLRNRTPFRKRSINATKEFRVECIPPGNYAFGIPVSSYNYTGGSPLPSEWTRDNYTLAIVFQGGDSEYLVGAFTIKENQTGPVVSD